MYARRTIQFLCLIVSIFLLSGCGTRASAVRSTAVDYSHVDKETQADLRASKLPPVDDIVAEVISYGRKFLGKPYRYRGPSSWPMDCSGYISHIYDKFGISLPRSSREQAEVSTKIKQPQPGDLIFFSGRNASSKRVGHVALVISVDPKHGVKMMHSTNSRGIMVEYVDGSAYFKKRLLNYGRIPAFTDGKRAQGYGALLDDEDYNLPKLELIPPVILKISPLVVKNDYLRIASHGITISPSGSIALMSPTLL